MFTPAFQTTVIYLINLLNAVLTVPGIDYASEKMTKLLKELLAETQREDGFYDPDVPLLELTIGDRETFEAALWKAVPRNDPAIWVRLKIVVLAMSTPPKTVKLGTEGRVFLTGSFENASLLPDTISKGRMSHRAIVELVFALCGADAPMSAMRINATPEAGISIFFEGDNVADAYVVFTPEELGLAWREEGGALFLDVKEP